MKAITILVLAAFSGLASAKVSFDTETGNTSFRVNGKQVTAVEAMNAAVAGQKVYRCKPKATSTKKITYAGNSEVAEVVECTLVELKVSTKTGSPKWKNAK